MSVKVSETTGTQTCARCGHPVTKASAMGRLTHRLLGRKPPRVECAAPTDHGWPCPCRSRAHHR